MGVYPGSTAPVCSRNGISAAIGKTLIYRCRFAARICANNNFAAMNARSVKVSLHDFISGNENALQVFIEQAFAPGGVQLITSVAMRRGLCNAFLLLDNLQSTFSRTLFCGVSFCAILYTTICLGYETILLTSPTKILSAQPQSQTACLRLQTTSWQHSS